MLLSSKSPSKSLRMSRHAQPGFMIGVTMTLVWMRWRGSVCSMTVDPKTIAAWIGVLVTAGGVIAGTVKFIFWVVDEIQKLRTHEGFSAPEKTLQLAAKAEGACWWAMGRMGYDPTMQIVARMFVTNIASVPVRIPQVELRHGFLGRKRVSGSVSVSRSLNENMY